MTEEEYAALQSLHQQVRKIAYGFLDAMYAELAARTGEEERVVRAKIEYIARSRQKDEVLVLEDILTYHRMNSSLFFRSDEEQTAEEQ